MRYHEVLRWLREGDPVISYFVHRDFLGSPKEELDLLQLSMEIDDGWVKNLLDQQHEYGTWADNLVENQWKSTLWILTLLRRFNISPYIMKAQLGAQVMLENGQNSDGGYNHHPGEKNSKVCISAMILGVLAFFKIKDPRREAIFEFLVEKQNDDGGWTCDGDVSSLRTTLIVLDALHQYVRVNNRNATSIHTMRDHAHEFILSKELVNMDKDGHIDQECLKFTFPSYQHYNILDTLDYFKNLDFGYDIRFEKAIQHIRDGKTENNVWELVKIPKGEYWQEYEKLGESRWITIKAMGVLRWWQKVSKFKY